MSRTHDTNCSSGIGSESITARCLKTKPDELISGYHATVTWDGTKIIATATGDTKITGSTIEMTANYVSSTGVVTWTCAGSIDSKFRPSSCK